MVLISIIINKKRASYVLTLLRDPTLGGAATTYKGVELCFPNHELTIA